MERDPLELTNLIDDPAYHNTVQALKAELAQLQVHDGDQPYAGPSTPHPEWGEGLQEHS